MFVKGKYDRVLAVDCETTGMCFGVPDPTINLDTGEKHQSLSWGAIIADADTLEPINRLYVEIKWNEDSLRQREDDQTFGAYAEGVHGLNIMHLENNGLDEEDAVVEIAEFILSGWDVGGSIQLLGHNVGTFDAYFLRSLFAKYELPFRFNHRGIDTSTIGFINFGVYTSDQLFELMGTQREAHNALEDIELSLKAARVAKNMCRGLV